MGDRAKHARTEHKLLHTQKGGSISGGSGGGDARAGASPLHEASIAKSSNQQQGGGGGAAWSKGPNSPNARSFLATREFKAPSYHEVIRHRAFSASSSSQDNGGSETLAQFLATTATTDNAPNSTSGDSPEVVEAVAKGEWTRPAGDYVLRDGIGKPIKDATIVGKVRVCGQHALVDAMRAIVVA